MCVFFYWHRNSGICCDTLLNDFYLMNKEKEMGFFEKFEKVKVKKTKTVKKDKLSVIEMIKRDIENQHKLLKGEPVLNAKKKSIRSWFKSHKEKDDNGNDGVFIPFVGITALFGDYEMPYKNSDRKSILDELLKDIESGEGSKYIAEVEKKLKKAEDEAKKKREQNAKKKTEK
jgi:hypothetical protein